MAVIAAAAIAVPAATEVADGVGFGALQGLMVGDVNTAGDEVREGQDLGVGGA